MAIQNRRGYLADFDPKKMLPGEWGVSIDTESKNQHVYMCFSPGVVKRMATYEDFESDMEAMSEAIRLANQASADANEALEKANDILENGGSGGGAGEDGGYYTPEISQTEEQAAAGTMTVSYTASKDGMGAVEEQTVKLPAGKNGTSPTVSVSDITGGHRITITDVNGTKTVDVMDGADGKTAYEYAQDGGYTGTEEDFAEMLAEIVNDGVPESLIVSYADGSYISNDGATASHASLTLVEAHGLIAGRKLRCTLWANPNTTINTHCGYKADGSYAYTATSNPFAWTLVEGSDSVYEAIIPSNVAILKFNIYTTQKETAVCYMLAEEEEDGYAYTPSYITNSVGKPLGFASEKKLIAFGDSITAGVYSSASGLNTTYTDSYIIHFCSKLGLALTNKALSGTTLANVAHPTETTLTADKSIYGQVTATDLSAYDFIVIAGGCNDGALQTTVGELGSTDNTTTYGALESMCEYIVSNMKTTAQVIFITPIPLLRDLTTPLETYRNAVFEVAVKYGFNVVDGYRLGFPYETGDFADVVFPDGCHPSLAGHKMYANSLLGILVGEMGGTDSSVTTENWVFTLADGTTVTKAVCIG